MTLHALARGFQAVLLALVVLLAYSAATWTPTGAPAEFVQAAFYCLSAAFVIEMARVVVATDWRTDPPAGHAPRRGD